MTLVTQLSFLLGNVVVLLLLKVMKKQAENNKDFFLIKSNQNILLALELMVY